MVEKTPIRGITQLTLCTPLTLLLDRFQQVNHQNLGKAQYLHQGCECDLGKRTEIDPIGLKYGVLLHF